MFDKEFGKMIVAVIIATIAVELIKFGISKFTNKNNYDETDIIGNYPTESEEFIY